MYLHLGNDAVVRKEDILAVFDLDNTSQSHLTRSYLAAAEKSGSVVNAEKLYSRSNRHRRTDGLFESTESRDTAAPQRERGN